VRDGLVEQAQRVAHAAFRVARQQRQRVGVDVDLLGGGDVTQLPGDVGGRDGPELIDLSPRLDGVGDLVQLGRRHDEDDVRRRLFHRLQQRVERVVRELVDLVDDEDLVAVARRRHRQVADDHLAHVVDAGVAGRVDLEHVEVAALGDLHARVADAARVGGRSLLAVQRPRQDPRGRRLADAARAGEDKGLRQPSARQGVAERLGDGLLADDVGETLGTPLPGDDLVCHERAGWTVRRPRAPPRPGGPCGTGKDLLSAAAFRP